MRAGSGFCAGRENGLNAVPEGGSAAGLTATIGPWIVVRWVPGGPGPCLNFLSARQQRRCACASRLRAMHHGEVAAYFGV